MNDTQIFRLTHTLGGEPYQVGTDSDNALALCHTGLGIACIGVGHCLHNHRMTASHGNVTYMYIYCRAAIVIEKIHALLIYFFKGNTSIQYPSGSMIK